MPRHSLPDISVPDGTSAFAETETRVERLNSGSRAGKKTAPVWLSPEAKKQLDLMSVENDMTIQQIMIEAVNLVFAKYGKPTIA